MSLMKRRRYPVTESSQAIRKTPPRAKQAPAEPGSSSFHATPLHASPIPICRRHRSTRPCHRRASVRGCPVLAGAIACWPAEGSPTPLRFEGEDQVRIPQGTYPHRLPCREQDQTRHRRCQREQPLRRRRSAQGTVGSSHCRAHRTVRQSVCAGDERLDPWGTAWEMRFHLRHATADEVHCHELPIEWQLDEVRSPDEESRMVWTQPVLRNHTKAPGTPAKYPCNAATACLTFAGWLSRCGVTAHTGIPGVCQSGIN